VFTGAARKNNTVRQSKKTAACLFDINNKHFYKEQDSYPSSPPIIFTGFLSPTISTHTEGPETQQFNRMSQKLKVWAMEN